MSALFRLLASLKLAFVLLLLLVLVIVVTQAGTATGSPWLSLVLFAMACNLLAAIATNASFRTQPALLAFHLFLLGTILSLGLNSLYHFDGHIELVEGESFDPQNVETTSRGLWRSPSMAQINFVQGPIRVDYGTGLTRRTTTSEVALRRAGEAPTTMEFGDRRSLNVGDYRFLTSFNKGYSIILIWTSQGGAAQIGAVNLPSYPELEWKQVNDWATPQGEPVQLELLLPAPAAREAEWQFNGRQRNYRIVVTSATERRTALAEGESLALAGGTLTIRELRPWMGYRIDAYPLLPWAFASAMLAVIALAWHFQTRFRLLTPNRQLRSAGRSGRAYIG